MGNPIILDDLLDQTNSLSDIRPFGFDFDDKLLGCVVAASPDGSPFPAYPLFLLVGYNTNNHHYERMQWWNMVKMIGR